MSKLSWLTMLCDAKKNFVYSKMLRQFELAFPTRSSEDESSVPCGAYDYV